MNRTHTDWPRVGWFCAMVAMSAWVGWQVQPWMHGNEEARSIIVNVFSFLAGFLMTVMTLLGEPGLVRGRTWRSDAVKRPNLVRRLTRHKWLFVSYLAVLALAFMAALVIRHAPDSPLVVHLERWYLGCAVFAFIYSVLLPFRLQRLQLERFDELVEARRNGQK